MIRFSLRLLDWLRRREPAVLISLLLAVLGTWAFVKIAGEVLEGDTTAFDRWALKTLRQPGDPKTPIGPHALQIMARDITGLGGIVVLTMVSLAAIGFLWLARQRHLAVFVALAALGGMGLSFLLKSLFDRPRPDVVPHLVEVSSASFPSGHSMMSAIVYLTLGGLLASAMPERRLKIYLLTVAVLLTALVGMTRIYLGVHYPTDVLAGWAAGLVWALLSWLLARRLRETGQIEEEPEPESFAE